MSEVNTNYTRATLPQTHFPDNYSKVYWQKDEYSSMDTAGKIFLNSALVGIFGMMGGVVVTIVVAFATNNLICFISIPVCIVLSMGATATKCFFKKRKLKKIVEENEQKKLKLSDIRQIYSRETNQTRQFAEVAADVCFFH